MSVTVKWNGPTTVEDAVETPGDGMTIGEFCTAFADAHGIDGEKHPRFTVDGEVLPADSPVDLLAGTTVFITVDQPDPSVEQAQHAVHGTAHDLLVASQSGDKDEIKAAKKAHQDATVALTDAQAASQAAADEAAKNAPRPLGRHVEHDPASRNFAAARATKRKTVLHKRTRAPFDQGDLGSCTGNAMCGVLVTQPWKHSRLSERTAVELYELATTLDNAPGAYPPDDTGSSGLAVCKAAKQLEYISAYHHAFGIDHALDALVLAPVIIGISWYTSFDTPDENGVIEIADGATVRGGHEVELLGIDVDAETVTGINSWGTGWGAKGRFTMSWATLARLLAEQGDVTVPVP